jgi:hypothetical protein
MPVFLDIFFSVCLPILVLAGLGWGLDRLYDLDLKSLVKLNIYLFVPAFILTRLSSSDLGGKLGLSIVGFTVCIIFSMGALSWLVCKLRKQNPVDCYSMQLATMIYNSGNWGIPLMTLAFSQYGGVRARDNESDELFARRVPCECGKQRAKGVDRSYSEAAFPVGNPDSVDPAIFWKPA